jgi:DNA primase
MTAAQDWFVCQLDGIEGASAREYLHKRGLTAATIKSFGLGFAPDSRGKLKTALSNFGNEKLIDSGLLISVDDKEPYDRFRGRLMIPIRDARSRVIAFGGRIIGEGEPKYLNSPETPLFDKGRTLYNIDRASAASRKAGRVVVVEGYMDVIGMAQAGIDEVVAPLGTALTEHQIARLWRMSSSPIICFDGDAAGQKAAGRAAERALPELSDGNTLQFLTLSNGQDPDDLAKIANGAFFRTLLDNAEPLDQFIWRFEREREPLSTPESRAGLKKRLDELVQKITDKANREQYQNLFRKQFYEQFGWRKPEIDRVRIIAAQKPLAGRHKPDLHSTFRAVLLGLSRYPAVLHSHLEHVQNLVFSDEGHQEWQQILVDAAMDRPTLDEDLIDTILTQSSTNPDLYRNLHADLNFTFVFRRHDNERHAERDLADVITAMVALQNIKGRLAEADTPAERDRASSNEDDWFILQKLRKMAPAQLAKISDIKSQTFEFEETRENRLHG